MSFVNTIRDWFAGAAAAVTSGSSGHDFGNEEQPGWNSWNSYWDRVMPAREIVTDEGIRIVPKRSGFSQITRAEMQDAARAVALLPERDRQMLAERGVPIIIDAKGKLENNLVGATDIEQRDGAPWLPKQIRIAFRSGHDGSRHPLEVIQHEVGHAINVLRHQDRSEAAAERYARRN